MLCAVSGAPTSGRPLTTRPVLAAFPSLSHRPPLLPGPALTSLRNGSNQNPSLRICFWGNTSQATSFYKARVSEHRDAHGWLSHFPRQEIPVHTASRKPNRLERTGLKLDATRAPGQGHGAPTPHPRPSPVQEKVRNPEGGQSTVGRARCPLHAHQGGKVGLEAGLGLQVPDAPAGESPGTGGAEGRQEGGAAELPTSGVINLPSAEIPHQRLRRIPAAGWARRTCLLTTGPHLCLLIGGETRALLPLGQGQGMKAHSPPRPQTPPRPLLLPRSVPSTAPDPEAGSLLLPTRYVASRMSSPRLLCSLESWSHSHLSLTWPSLSSSKLTVTVLPARGDQWQLSTTRPKPNSQSPPPPAPGNGNSVLPAAQARYLGVILDSPSPSSCPPSAKPAGAGLRIQHVRRGRHGPASSSLPQDIASASSVASRLPRLYPCSPQSSLHLAAKSDREDKWQMVTEEKAKSLLYPTW